MNQEIQSMIQSIMERLRSKENERGETVAFLKRVEREIGFELHFSGKSALLERLMYINEKPGLIELLLGDWWELEFCKLVSEWGLHTYRFQKWKTHSKARAGRGSYKIEDSISLPDIWIIGNKRTGLCEIKHTSPTRYDTYSIDRDDWEDRKILLSCDPPLPQFYIIHNHKRFGKWAPENVPEDWVGIRLEEDMRFLEGKSGKKLYIRKEFIPLEQLLADFIELQKGYKKMPFL